MSMRLSPGRSGSTGDQRIYLWLAIGLVILITVAAALVFAVQRAGDESSLSITALGLPAPGAARPVVPAVSAATPIPPTALTPVSAPRSAGDMAWWFADVGQSATISTMLVLFNPGDAVVTGTAAYVGEAGPVGQAPFTVQPGSRLSLGTPVTGPLAVSLAANGRFYAGRVATGARDTAAVGGGVPATTWYLPLVETGFDQFDDLVTLANFNAAAARVSLAIFSEAGITQTLTYTVAASSRLTVPVTRVLAPSSSVRPGTPRGALVLSDIPIVVEQTTVMQGGGVYAVAGATELAKAWYLPEGNTRSGLETTLAVLNPGPSPARLLVTFLPEGKAPLIKSYTAGAFTPLRIRMNADIPDSAVGVMVESDQPVAVQRVTYVGGGQAAHSSVGATASAREWLVPYVSTVAPAVTVLVILNPGTSSAEVIAYLYGEDGRPPQKQVVEVAPSSRFTLAMDRDVPSGLWSARLVSSQPVVVERVTTYGTLSGGASSLGVGR